MTRTTNRTMVVSSSGFSEKAKALTSATSFQATESYANFTTDGQKKAYFK